MNYLYIALYQGFDFCWWIEYGLVIKVTSHECHGASNHWQILFVQQLTNKKEIRKDTYYRPFMKRINRCQKAKEAESAST